MGGDEEGDDLEADVQLHDGGGETVGGGHRRVELQIGLDLDLTAGNGGNLKAACGSSSWRSLRPHRAG